MSETICFVDDDKEELRRFEEAMSGFFTCITATTYSECIEKLQKRKLSPDLWVLDLFFPDQGTTNSPAQLQEMAERYAELEQHNREFRGFLRTIGQGPEGGLKLLKECVQNHPAPAIMLTRKGTLEDALSCLDAGAAAVLKKPMPNTLSGSPEERVRQLDDAMKNEDHARYLMDKFRQVMGHRRSQQAFVAMWFHESMKDAYENGIAPAITANGYSPIRIDLKEHNNKIDDEIIAEIRRSRFLVADFTCEPKNARGGVYYEAGFAQGIGIPVIWTCKKTSLDDLHFDTRQYGHIGWKDPDDLLQQLKKRIAETIR